MKYHCNLCDYSTEAKNAWYNHKKSNKHLKLEQLNNQNILQESKEIKLLKDKINNIEKNNLEKQLEENKLIYENLLTEQKESYEKRLREQREIFDKQINNYEKLMLKSREDYDKQLEYLRELLEKEIDKTNNMYIANNNSNNTNNTINVVNYIKKNYNDAPAINDNEDYLQILGLKSIDDMKDMMISYNDQGKMADFFTNYIKKKYCNENLKLQSIFTTDISRNNFLARVDLEGGKTIWLTDKNGNHIKDKVIKSFREYSDNNLSDINRKLTLQIEEDGKVEEINKVMSVLFSIKDASLPEKILKQMGPIFQVNDMIIQDTGNQKKNKNIIVKGKYKL